MLNNSLQIICKCISDFLFSVSDDCDLTENQSSLFASGDRTEAISISLENLLFLYVDVDFKNAFILNIDDDVVDLKNVNGALKEIRSNWISFKLTIRKSQILYFSGFDSDSTLNNEILFFSVREFEKASESYLGLNKPLNRGEINSSKRTRIQVYGLDAAFGGSHIAVIPPNYSLAETSFERAENKLHLPQEAAIRKAVHFVTHEEICPNPINYELSWGYTDSHLAKNFRVALIQSLYVCLCSHFFSISELVFEGVKQIRVSAGNDANTCSSIDVANTLCEMVHWCYAEEDVETRKTLIADRISLEVKESGSLLELTHEILLNTLQQSKSKYKYVIAERNDNYRKELKEVYDDIKIYSETFTEKSLELTKGLTTDVLSIGFVFTIGAFAKATAYGDSILKSEIASYLLTSIAIYLVASFFLRLWHAISALRQKNVLFDDWSNRLRSHISIDEIKFLKRKLTLDSERHFETTYTVIGAIHVLLAMLAIWLPSLV